MLSRVSKLIGTQRGGGRGRGRGRGGYGNRGLRAPRVDIEKNNELYEKHYNSIIPEEQQNAFWDSLRSELPVSFRFTGSKGYKRFHAEFYHS